MNAKAQPSAALVTLLQTCLARAVSNFKAYDVPKICSRIGLANGTEQEAMGSKTRYAMVRLTSLPWEEVLATARKLLKIEIDFDLSEVVAKIEEIGQDTISEITRRRIISIFDNRRICTEIEEIDFLRRLWPIDTMPPIYKQGFRDNSLADEIIQHTIKNYDWTNRDLLEFVGAITCSQLHFFRFLALVTDPLVQTSEAQAELVEKIDGYLFHDGYKLVQVRMRSGCPFYDVRPLPKGAPGDEGISKVLHAFDPNEIHGRWKTILDSRDSDPGRTITLARTLLEDVCKWIIVEAGKNYEEKAELPDLYKQLSKILKLAPDDHTEEIFKQILRGCHSVVQGLGSLRNKLGDAHSLGPIRARPSPRHAELAANLSGAMATFLVSTWRVRQQEDAKARTV